MSASSDLAAEIENLHGRMRELEQTVNAQFLGQAEVTELLLITILAGGHALLEGAPGLGKTTLVSCLARSLDLDFRRIQFTPDLMPPDILGTRILEFEEGGHRQFTFERGPIFTQVLLADEINRGTPRTQSALLEAMQEGQVTTFGESRRLEEPFLVIATQNPIEMEGTYPLPEAQLDRFLVKIELVMPGRDALMDIFAATTGAKVDVPRALLRREEVVRLRELVREVPVREELLREVADLVLATHPGHERAPDKVRSLVRYGSGPRGGQAILLAAKARALLKGRLHVEDEDIERLAGPALRHRLVLGYEGEASGTPVDEIVADALQAVRRR